MSISDDLRKFLLKEGATEVGFANLGSDSPKIALKSGVVIYIKYSKEVIESIKKHPTLEYLNEVNLLNNRLDEMVMKGEAFLKDKGYKAYGQTTERVIVSEEDKRLEMPHKTIATKAGLGWIGNSALFVTPEYGSAIRLSSILTNAPLDYGKAITSSLCNRCTNCRDECPGDAVSGINWNSTMDRDQFFDYKKCMKKAKKLSKKYLDEDTTLCGKCIYVCPHTQKYLRK